jgi:hypothetical protein
LPAGRGPTAHRNHPDRQKARVRTPIIPAYLFETAANLLLANSNTGFRHIGDLQLMRPWTAALVFPLLVAGNATSTPQLIGASGRLSSSPFVLAADDTTIDTKSPLPDPYTFPLKVSTNRRYLIDQRNRPFLMVGDSPQMIVANLSVEEAAVYMANRREYGINTLWINLLCNFSDGCNADAKTGDGLAPFLIPGDISSQNPAYFQRADDIIRVAAAHGMLVLLDPIETSSWLPVLRAASIDRAFRYGQFLGRHYKDFTNIIWMHGNDFQTWRDPTDDALVQAVARGIRSEDRTHLHTVELNYETSGSLDDPTWAPLIELDAAYTYFPTYAQVLTEYNRAGFMPVFMVEANYEFERADEGSPRSLRRQEYWTMLSGASGQLYGSAVTWRLEKGWESKINTPGAIQLRLMRNLFAERKWYDLVPDQDHAVVIDGYGWFAEYVGKLTAYVGRLHLPSVLVGRIKRYLGVNWNTFAPAARTSDGMLMIAYVPSAQPITVDMSKLVGSVSARWYDPTNGAYAVINGSPLPNKNTRQFFPPNRNAAGDSDWVLVLETDPFG